MQNGMLRRKGRNRKRVFQISHINRSVERCRESIRWMRELFLQCAQQKCFIGIAIYCSPFFFFRIQSRSSLKADLRLRQNFHILYISRVFIGNLIR